MEGKGASMDRVINKEEEKPLHTCGHLSPVSKETNPPFTGVYNFLLLWHDDVAEGQGWSKQTGVIKEQTRKGHWMGNYVKHNNKVSSTGNLHHDSSVLCIMSGTNQITFRLWLYQTLHTW